MGKRASERERERERERAQTGWRGEDGAKGGGEGMRWSGEGHAVGSAAEIPRRVNANVMFFV
jgi:hypothetical protein